MFKSIVIYYSQTGNTKKIAQAIHEGITQAGAYSDIARLRDVAPQELENYDLIGLGSPVIHHRELPNVTKFIYSMKSLDGKHSFAFCTHGALPGYYFARVVPAMIQMGLTVIGWKNWFTRVFHPFIPKPYYTDGHPDEIDLKEARDFGKAMVERSRNIYMGETGLIPTLPRGREYDKIYRPVSPDGYAETSIFGKLEAQVQFKVNKEKCRYPRCTHCIDNCPMGAIDLSGTEPIFSKSCDVCWLCWQTCPRGAIEVVDLEAIEKAHRPLITLLLKKSIETFEARGSFRRLIPEGEIGYGNLFCRTPTPRFKIDG